MRDGSVIGPGALDVTAAALKHSPDVDAFAPPRADSGERRTALMAAID